MYSIRLRGAFIIEIVYGSCRFEAVVPLIVRWKDERLHSVCYIWGSKQPTIMKTRRADTSDKFRSYLFQSHLLQGLRIFCETKSGIEGKSILAKMPVIDTIK